MLNYDFITFWHTSQWLFFRHTIPWLFFDILCYDIFLHTMPKHFLITFSGKLHHNFFFFFYPHILCYDCFQRILFGCMVAQWFARFQHLSAGSIPSPGWAFLFGICMFFQTFFDILWLFSGGFLDILWLFSAYYTMTFFSILYYDFFQHTILWLSWPQFLLLIHYLYFKL